jgi:hypothetical protein
VRNALERGDDAVGGGRAATGARVAGERLRQPATGRGRDARLRR